MPEPVIVADDLGIRFARNRRRRLKFRELLLQGSRSIDPTQFWAFRHVTFSVHEGEGVGVVGANGEGKSTLLRLIAGILLPDEGTVDVHGDVAPLIGLTAGFSGDLTARDNVYLLAGLHNRSRRWVDERFDDIIAFAEVGEFVDTPVRHFSSGMKARLGFAVVTLLDEPIILIDEALAVGDRKFREKCYVRMEALLSEGRTLFFVSHSDSDLKRFCTRGLYLRKGELKRDGDINEILDEYAEDQGG